MPEQEFQLNPLAQVAQDRVGSEQASGIKIPPPLDQALESWQILRTDTENKFLTHSPTDPMLPESS